MIGPWHHMTPYVWTKRVYTLPPKNTTLISRFFIMFMVTLDQVQWPQFMSTKGNTPGSIVEVAFGQKFTKLHSSPKERQLHKSTQETLFKTPEIVFSYMATLTIDLWPWPTYLAERSPSSVPIWECSLTDRLTLTHWRDRFHILDHWRVRE